MKNRKSIITAIIFHTTFSTFSFSQSVINSRFIDKEDGKQNLFTIDTLIINDIFYETLSTEGSPFNNKENPQIDSVIIRKLYSGLEDEKIKHYYTYDSVGNVATEEMEFYWRYINNYNSVGNKINYVWQTWNDSQWVNNSYSINVFDDKGKRVLYRYFNWIDANWIEVYRVSHFYNTNGDETSYLSEDWDGSKWVNSFQKTYYYDSNYVLISTLHQNWGSGDWTGTTWRVIYSYDSKGSKILHLSESLIDNQWIKDIRWRYEYDENNNNNLTYYDVWGGTWINSYRWTETFNDNGGVVSQLEEGYESGIWINSRKIEYTYNEKGCFLYSKGARWIESDRNWISGNVPIFIYDADGNRREYFGTEVHVYYTDVTDVEKEIKPNLAYSLSQNYPNPFNPTTTIKYTIPSVVADFGRRVVLTVYDILGRKIKTLVNEVKASGVYEIEFNASELISGVYFYQLYCGKYVQTKKMILIK